MDPSYAAQIIGGQIAKLDSGATLAKPRPVGQLEEQTRRLESLVTTANNVADALANRLSPAPQTCSPEETSPVAILPSIEHQITRLERLNKTLQQLSELI